MGLSPLKEKHFCLRKSQPLAVRITFFRCRKSTFAYAKASLWLSEKHFCLWQKQGFALADYFFPLHNYFFSVQKKQAFLSVGVLTYPPMKVAIRASRGFAPFDTSASQLMAATARWAAFAASKSADAIPSGLHRRAVLHSNTTSLEWAKPILRFRAF